MSESEHLEEILAHERIWRSLYDRAKVVLDRFSQQEDGGKLGYWIVSDDWGPDFLQIEVTDLRLLRRDAIGALKRVLDDFPGWQIAVWIFALDTEPPLPKIGLLISDGRVFHDLKREYLPPEFNNEPMIGEYRADYSRLAPEEIAHEDPELAELYANSIPVSR